MGGGAKPKCEFQTEFCVWGRERESCELNSWVLDLKILASIAKDLTGHKHSNLDPNGRDEILSVRFEFYCWERCGGEGREIMGWMLRTAEKSTFLGQEDKKGSKQPDAGWENPVFVCLIERPQVTRSNLSMSTPKLTIKLQLRQK